MRQLLSIAVICGLIGAVVPAAATPKATLQARLVDAIKERRGLPNDAKVAIVNVTIGSPAIWKTATKVISVTLPNRERGVGFITAKVLLATPAGTRLIWVRCQAEVNARVVVAKRMLTRRHTVTRHDVKLDWRTLGNQTPILKIADVVGKLTKTVLRPGTILTQRHLRVVAAVQRGSRVNAILRAGPVTIRTLAEALGKGHIGDRVRVRIVATGKIVTAIVKRTGRVEILR